MIYRYGVFVTGGSTDQWFYFSKLFNDKRVNDDR